MRPGRRLVGATLGSRTLIVLGACACVAPGLAAEPPPAARAEVQHLLTYLATSGCDFFRNGKWHGAQQARDHLARKYDYLVKKDRVKSTEDFVRLAATGSSVSGKEYLVRCNAGVAVPSASWLSAELAKHRKGRADGEQ